MVYRYFFKFININNGGTGTGWEVVGREWTQLIIIIIVISFFCLSSFMIKHSDGLTKNVCIWKIILFALKELFLAFLCWFFILFIYLFSYFCLLPYL